MSYQYDEKFLTDVTLDENVYLLGFLWADGYIDKKYRVNVEIKATDFSYLVPILNKFGIVSYKERQRMRDNKPFGSVQTRLDICDMKLNEWLRNLQYDKKSHISPTKVLSIIPKEKKYLWWRGFFDGDGGFYCKGAQRSFAIWGTFDQDWNDLLELFHELNIENPRFIQYSRNNNMHKSSCYKVSIRSDIKKLGEYIYSNLENIGFSRKYQTYLECIETPKPEFQNKPSKTKGIRFNIWTGKWICRKTINGKRSQLGSFNTYEEALKVFTE